MGYGRCHLCEQVTLLCDSHAIPNAQFRPLLSEGNGSAISFVDDANTPISRSSDSWSAEQFCADCESLLNKEYDCYGISVFKAKAGRVVRMKSAISIQNIDTARFRSFLLSVLWRMAISPHPSYLNARLPDIAKEELRQCFAKRGRFPSSRLHVTLERLHDSTAEGAIPSEQFRNVVISPFLRTHERHYAVCFVLFGFLVQVHVPAMPRTARKLSWAIDQRSSTVFAPHLEFTNFPEFFSAAVRAVAKEMRGQSRLADASQETPSK
jgi:hypothetical protein